jgi:hypothetical protein
MTWKPSAPGNSCPSTASAAISTNLPNSARRRGGQDRSAAAEQPERASDQR